MIRLCASLPACVIYAYTIAYCQPPKRLFISDPGSNFLRSCFVYLANPALQGKGKLEEEFCWNMTSHQSIGEILVTVRKTLSAGHQGTPNLDEQPHSSRRSRFPRSQSCPLRCDKSVRKSITCLLERSDYVAYRHPY